MEHHGVTILKEFLCVYSDLFYLCKVLRRLPRQTTLKLRSLLLVSSYFLPTSEAHARACILQWLLRNCSLLICSFFLQKSQTQIPTRPRQEIGMWDVGLGVSKTQPVRTDLIHLGAPTRCHHQEILIHCNEFYNFPEKSKIYNFMYNLLIFKVETLFF